jgi:pyruvate/2-oxoglutarate dehydrogenase complex dihydrolipoamide dehydrogenase (E3) component
LKKFGVVVELEQEITAKEIEKRKPDVVVMAIGSDPDLPRIPGMERDNVAEAVDVLAGRTDVKGSVVVVGGGMVGCEVAAFLAKKNRLVTLVTRRSEQQLAVDMHAPMRKWFFSNFWPELGIKVISHVTFAEVTEKGLAVTDQAGTRQLIPGDIVVFALGLKSKKPLADAIKSENIEYHQIGDCNEPRQIRDAIREGFEVGMKI